MDIVKQCLICNKPLGQESQDLDFRLCLEHRKCIICTENLKPVEVHTAILELYETLEASPAAKAKGPEEVIEILKTLIKHSRCAILEKNTPEQDANVVVKQSYINHVNNCRLICDVDLDLNIDTNQKQGELGVTRLFQNYRIDEQILFIAKMEAIIEHAQKLTQLNPKTIREKLQIRDREKAKKASEQALTSSRPITTAQTDEKEVILGEIMKRTGIVDRKVAKQFIRNRSNAINALVAMGVDVNVATNKVDEDLVKQGRLKSA